MKIIAALPARYHATRFPGKLLADLHGKPVIQHTYEAVFQSSLFDDVYVVTDSDLIENATRDFGGNVIRSLQEHECGSDRIAEAFSSVDVDIIINVQADEPFICPKSLRQLIHIFEKDKHQLVDLASLMIPITQKEVIESPNIVKVIVDQQQRALYFSRLPIPFLRTNDTSSIYFKHVGVYAFRKQALMDFYNQPVTPLENAEKIEAIRYLEIGKTIQMLETDFDGVGIDVPEDLERAKQLML